MLKPIGLGIVKYVMVSIDPSIDYRTHHSLCIVHRYFLAHGLIRTIWNNVREGFKDVAEAQWL